MGTIRARVALLDSTGNALECQDANHLLGFVNQFARPLLGNYRAGFHYFPDPTTPNPGAPAAPGDEVLVLGEGRGWQHGSVSYARPQDMITGQPGESAIVHKDLRRGLWLYNSGLSEVIRDPAYGATGITGLAGTITITGSVGVTIAGPLALSGQTTPGSTALTGTCAGSGSDPQGGTVSISGTCSVTFPHTVTIVVNGTSYKIPSLT